MNAIDELKDCPWKRTRMSPTKEEIFHVIQYIMSRKLPIDTFLEFGCGVTSWYLSQLGFQDYIAVEEYEEAINKVQRYCLNVKVVRKWTDIPSKKYRYVLVDSHAGGDALGNERHKPFEYAILNNLLLNDTIMIAHDHTMVRDGDLSRRNITTGWHGVMNKYGWELVHQIELRKSFGIYEHKSFRG
jgi:hypothetical protein